MAMFKLQQRRTAKRWLAPTLKEFERRKAKLPQPLPNKRSTFLEWNYDAELFAFSNRLGETFESVLLRQALTSEDYLKQQREEQAKLGIEDSSPIEDRHNTTLAKEGRQLMSRYITGYLRHILNKLPEDGIEAIHSFLMSEPVLANISKLIGTKDLILTPDEPEPSPSTYATCLCALVGALASSSGPDRASLFVRDLVVSQLAENDVADLWCPSNPWAALQGVLQRERRSPPEARLAFEAGVGTLLEAYCVAIFSDKQMLGKGYGENTTIAKEMAAVDSLRRLFGTVDSMSPLPLEPEAGPTLSQLQPALNAPNPSLEQWSLEKLQNVVTK
ncbi:hypothetical protein B566_EDAN007232 [Ephemera danica]|nr:hypothetical protein B566_EDAN007232 [Ephemera danica]